jgi:alkanesulfonate monooxygenase SsuD/methylene tetrahydromethanopterin reductase-like flavin-dependent oxidoreductase (luciferase family)
MAVTGTNSLLFLLPYEFQQHLSSSSRRQGYISSSSSSHSLMKHSVTLYFVHKLHQKRKNFSLLQIQGLQAAAASSTHCPSTTRIPVVYSDDDDDAAAAAVCAIQPVTDLKVSDTVVHDAAAEELLPSSAMAVAAAIGTRFSVVSKTEECKHMLSAASAEFLALCDEQLALCEEIVGPNAKFTV